MDFSILYALQHLHNAVLDRVMVGITSLGNGGMDLDCADRRFLNPSEIPEMRCKNGDRADFRFDFM